MTHDMPPFRLTHWRYVLEPVARAEDCLEWYHQRMHELDDADLFAKVPKDKMFSNVNDAHIDSRVLLDQE